VVAERDDELVGHLRAGGHVLVDERLVLKLAPLRRREEAPAATAGLPSQHHLSVLKPRPQPQVFVSSEEARQ
jgi:hypothetical protein